MTLTSDTSSINAPGLNHSTRRGPFKATQIWNEIIDHLKSRVELKRRRMKMKTYENCFTGQDAVDVVLTYLLSEKNTFSSDLTREKAIKLCQSLMDRQVFSPVSARNSENKKSFDDSQTKLYRFVGPDSESETSSTTTESSDEDQSECSSLDDSRRHDLTFCIHSKFQPSPVDDFIYNPMEVSTQVDPLQEIGSLQLCSTSLKSDISILEYNSLKTLPDVSTEALKDLWKEVALCKLLTIVDLSFVEGLLEEKPNRKEFQQNFTISTVSSKRRNTLVSGIKDPFMKTAVKCIECLPKSTVILEKDFVRECTPGSKIQSFYALSQHYINTEEPMLPDGFIDLHLAILNLILQEKDQKAIEALRLDMILLPRDVREELRRLLKFMSAACKESIQIDSRENNETLMLMTFTDTILKHKIFSNKLARVLILFMVKHVRDIFTIPKDIRVRVNSRIDGLKTGKVPPVRDDVYCSQVTIDEYQKQSEICTEIALVQMMNTILDDTQIHPKDKKQRLRQFQKHHPNIYNKFFSGML